MLTRIARFGFVVAASLVLVGAGTSAFAAKKAAKEDAKAVSFGVNADWSDDADFGVGGRVIVNLDKQLKGLEAVGSFDYFFPSAGDVGDIEGDGVDVDVTYFEVNLNAVYKFKLENSSLTPYVGSGLNIAHGNVGASVDLGDFGSVGGSVSNTEVGLNILGGVIINKKFFVEAKFEAGGGEMFVVSGGIRF
jgi:hypothetical protein